MPKLQKQAKRVLNFGRSKLWLSDGYGSKMLERLQGKKGVGGNCKPGCGQRLTQDYFTDIEMEAFKSDKAYRQFRCLIEEDLGSTHEISFRGHPLQEIFSKKFSEMMRTKTMTKPHIAEALIPDFPVGCRRITPGPGYLEALCQDNVGCRSIPAGRADHSAT